MNSDSYKVWRIATLQKPREDEARKILERVAKQVRPIMRKRKWKVKCLAEFLPSNPILFGLNHGAGEKIEIRLRRPDWGMEFLPYEFILDILLHELCHNTYSAHDEKFFRLWEELRRECPMNAKEKSMNRSLSEGSSNKRQNLERSSSEGLMNKNLERSLSDSWMKYGQNSSRGYDSGGNPWNNSSYPRQNSSGEDAFPFHIFIFILAFFVLFISR